MPFSTKYIREVLTLHGLLTLAFYFELPLHRTENTPKQSLILASSVIQLSIRGTQLSFPLQHSLSLSILFLMHVGCFIFTSSSHINHQRKRQLQKKVKRKSTFSCLISFLNFQKALSSWSSLKQVLP